MGTSGRCARSRRDARCHCRLGAGGLPGTRPPLFSRHTAHDRKHHPGQRACRMREWPPGEPATGRAESGMQNRMTSQAGASWFCESCVMSVPGMAIQPVAADN